MTDNSNLRDAVYSMHKGAGRKIHSLDSLKKGEHSYFSLMLEGAYVIGLPLRPDDGNYRSYHYAFCIIDENMFNRELRSVKCEEFITKEPGQKSLIVWLDKKFFDHFVNVDSNVVETGIDRAIDVMNDAKYNLRKAQTGFYTSLAASVAYMDFAFIRDIDQLSERAPGATGIVVGATLAAFNVALTKPYRSFNQSMSNNIKALYSTSGMGGMEADDSVKYLRYEASRYYDEIKPTPLQKMIEKVTLVSPNKFNNKIAQNLYRDHQNGSGISL